MKGWARETTARGDRRMKFEHLESLETGAADFRGTVPENVRNTPECHGTMNSEHVASLLGP